LTDEVDKRWEETEDFERCPNLMNCIEKINEVEFEVYCLEGLWAFCEKIPKTFLDLREPKEWLNNYLRKEVNNVE